MSALTSGTLYLNRSIKSFTNSITPHTFGVDVTGSKSVIQNRDEADWISGTNPSGTTGMREWASKEQKWGRGYGEFPALIYSSSRFVRNDTSNSYAFSSVSESQLFSANNQAEAIYCIGPSGAAYVSSDSVTASFYRRTKYTSGAWSLTIGGSFDPYLSELVSADWSNFDYKAVIDDCLLEDARLMVNENEFVSVDNLKVGDTVYTAHEKTLEWGHHKIYKYEKKPCTHKFVVTFVNGEVVNCTAGHLFMSEGHKKRRGKLRPGDTVMVWNGTSFDDLEIEKEELWDHDGYLYKIEIEDAHTYVTDNMILHHNIKI